MRWVVRIENKPELRIVISFEPFEESIVFTGQFKFKNGDWIDFCKENHSMNLDLETIKKIMFKTYTILKHRVDVYNSINEGFSFIKEIQIVDE